MRDREGKREIIKIERRRVSERERERGSRLRKGEREGKSKREKEVRDT